MKTVSIIFVVIFVLLSAIAGAAIAITIFQYLEIDAKLVNQAATISLNEPLKAVVDAKEPLDTRIEGNLDVVVPIDQYIDLPLNETLKPTIFFNSLVPIKTTVPVTQDIQINQMLPVDTKVKVRVMGMDISLPIRGEIPINLTVPLDLKVPLDQKVHLNFSAPVEARFKQNVHVPLRTEVKTNLPLDGRIKAPLQSAFAAEVEVKDKLNVLIEKTDVNIPVRDLKISLKDKVILPGRE